MNSSQRLILSSNSPRRQELLRNLGYTFEVKIFPTDESYPSGLSPEAIACHIAEQKALAFPEQDIRDRIIITADTIVSLEGKIFGKPATPAEAVEMLRKLSGNTHQVITAVCLRSASGIKSFCEVTDVTFKVLTDSEITYYVNTLQPMDKAGAYGIQEWIGMIGVIALKGSYFNVVGLPVHRLYQELQDFV
jgi:septum formation protein